MFKARSVALRFALLLSESWSRDTSCVGLVELVRLQCCPQFRCIVQSAEWVNDFELDISC